MTPPTKEQIEAAKRWTRGELNKEGALLLAWSEMPPESILLAALTAAEARIEELERQADLLFDIKEANERE